ncbi:hypothetical protein [Rummeliibacillus stabekisii]|uniref:hypothetical protein n=1 Tax=Rummeliibacillus stabekisii TaxID=241244 RepID=UPI0011734B17|nr:hypothetical protein [Rummeliibacillus stabekisii]MBB5171535.1 hypothetical protein [Rummeliibacillus stabekisii]GEL05502.1 hypothetical protein RST01_21290 [Rummeliibacillus stabekisii]
MKKSFITVMIFCLTFFTVSVSLGKTSQAASWKDLSKGWKYRVDAPLSDGGSENDYHVHVKGKVGKKTVEASETVKGGNSHKTNFDKEGVPNWVQKDVKNTKEFKSAKEKQKKLDKERDKVKSEFTWKDILLAPYVILAGIIALGIALVDIIKAGPGFIFG